MKKILVLFLITFIGISMTGQTYNDEFVLSVLENRGEIYIQFEATTDEIAEFSDIMSIDSYDGTTVYAYANKKQFGRFMLSGKKFSPVESYYSRNKALNMATTTAQMASWDKYPVYGVYVEMMQDYAADYPAICKLDTIGYSTDGRLLLVLKISDNVNYDEAEPEFLYSGQIHGDELVGGMMFLRLADYLLSNYGTDSQVTNLVNNLQIYISPLANPDGTYYGGDSDVSGSRRNNAQDIDLNRNYPDPLAGDHPDGESYGTETSHYMEFAEQRNFVMGGNSHSGAEVMNYPFDTYSTLPADNDWWDFVCREYADNAQTNSPAGYFTDEDNGVTNGYAWYTITGGRQDYMNYFQNCREVTMELSSVKLVDSDELPAYWNYNRQALLDYLEQATYGLRGIVTDSVTHEPLEAMVFVNSHDYLNSHVYSFPLHGDYYRYLFEGTYSVTYSAPGYKSKTFDINISNYESTVLDVELVNLESVAPTADFVSNTQNIDCNPEIQFTNTSEASASTVYLWDFGDGTNSNLENPVHAYNSNGIYTVKLFAENEHGEDSVIKTEYISVNFSQLDNVPDYVICEASGSVTAEYGTSGDLLWFNNINDETGFHTGSSYTTPVLNETTTYYIQEVTTGEIYSGGESDNSEGGSYVTDDNYLVFNCTQECLLKSVKVYAQGAGNRTIYLRDSEGGTIYSQEFYVEDGMQTVNLNFSLPSGNGMRLGCSATAGLYRGSTGIFSTFPYPYNIGGIISITESNVVWWNDGNRYYAYFYDWQIKMPDCYSERTPLNIYVNQNPEASFDYVIDGIGYATFTNTSSAADSYLWDFGDGTGSTDSNPSHQYLQDGDYIIKLTATSSCGSDEFTIQVTVTTGISSDYIHGASVFPNPAINNVMVTSENEIQNIRLIDITGKTVTETSDIPGHEQRINISELKPGIYILEITYSDNTKTITKLTKN